MLPDVSGMNLAVYYDTSLYAGGDYYDVVRLSDGRCGLLVADAEGHSAPAAVMMAMTCALFRSCPELHDQPGKVIDYINRNLCNVNKESFVTAIYGLYNHEDRTIQIARAGHPLPILFRLSEGKARELACDGVFLMGLDLYENIPVTTIALEKGDRLLLYTDGVTERFDPQNRPYGEGRLYRQLEQPAISDPRRVLSCIIEDLDTFSGGRPSEDDVAMLLAIVG